MKKGPAKTEVVMKSNPLRPADYAAFLTDLKARIQSARIAASRAVNRDLILLYWDIGRAILEKQTQYGWGESVVETLARDLRKAFPGTTGYSVSSLWRMRQFYATHSSKEFLAQAVRELVISIPWGHHVELLKKLFCLSPRRQPRRAPPHAFLEHVHLRVGVGLESRRQE